MATVLANKFSAEEKQFKSARAFMEQLKADASKLKALRQDPLDTLRSSSMPVEAADKVLVSRQVRALAAALDVQRQRADGKLEFELPRLDEETVVSAAAHVRTSVAAYPGIDLGEGREGDKEVAGFLTFKVKPWGIVLELSDDGVKFLEVGGVIGEGALAIAAGAIGAAGGPIGLAIAIVIAIYDAMFAVEGVWIAAANKGHGVALHMTWLHIWFYYTPLFFFPIPIALGPRDADVREPDPVGSKGVFRTTDYRKPTQTNVRHCHRLFFCETPRLTAPMLPVGLSELDTDHGTNVRVAARASDITSSDYRMHLGTWSKTKLYSAACTWLEHDAVATDIQSGRYDTVQDHPWTEPKQKTEARITFAVPFAKPPKVIVWLNALDTKKGKNCRVKARASQIDREGFTLHIDTWNDSVLYAACASWIAHEADRPGIFSGSFGTEQVRPWDKPQHEHSSSIAFPDNCFAKPPRVFAALAELDYHGGHNLRIKARVDAVTKTGMTWHLDSWADSVMYSAKAYFIAVED